MAVTKSPAPRRATGAQGAVTPTTSAAASTSVIGARIRERRQARGVSLRQFARDVEVSASFMSQLETGKVQPSVATLYSICTALEISLEDLFDGPEPSARPSPRPVDADGARRPWRSTEGTSDPSFERTTSSTLSLVHPRERRRIVLDSGVVWESLTATRTDHSDFMFVRYEVGGSSTLDDRLIRHSGTEYGYILTGTLEITLGFDTFRVSAGDAVSFDSSRPHRLVNVGDVPVEAIWMNLDH